MKIITFKNSDGETIEVRRGVGGGFQIRHSDITGDDWAGFYKKPEDMQRPGIASFFAERGIDVNSPEFQKGPNLLGAGHMVFNDNNCIPSAAERVLIEDAFKRLG